MLSNFEILVWELENILAKFWLQKGHEKKGIHWCQWKHMCRSKDEGGIGFRSMVSLIFPYWQNKTGGLLTTQILYFHECLKQSISQIMTSLTRDWGIQHMEKYLGDGWYFGKRALLKCGYRYECYN